MTADKKISLCKCGALSAIIAGLSYLMVAVLAFKMPPSIASYTASKTYFVDFQAIELSFIHLKVCLIIANIAMIGVTCTFMALVREKNFGVMLWVSILAIIGYSFGIYQTIVDMSVIPRLADIYMKEPSIIQDMIITIGVANPKMFIITLGLPGIWFLVVSFLGASNPDIPKLLILFGFLLGAGNILTAIAHAFVIMPILYLVAIGAIVFAPLWGLCEGVYLLSLIKKLEESSNP